MITRKSVLARISQENSNRSVRRMNWGVPYMETAVSDIRTEDGNADDTDQSVFIRVHLWLALGGPLGGFVFQ